MSKILTVFGATGSQGGSVIKEIHEHPTLSRTYKVRGVTRSLHSAVSRRLTAEGVDMVQVEPSTTDRGSQLTFKRPTLTKLSQCIVQS
jgi:uncharacterized protein YbjT (DUF2867 family)